MVKGVSLRFCTIPEARRPAEAHSWAGTMAPGARRKTDLPDRVESEGELNSGEERRSRELNSGKAKSFGVELGQKDLGRPAQERRKIV